ncbi:type VI protein secretion system component VasK [Bradyrhizobium sp. GM22.5]
MLGKRILRIVLTGVGLTSLAALVYLAGPMIAIGKYHPLESYIVRETIILLLVTGVAAFGSFSFYKHRKNSQKIAAGIAGEGEPVDDEPVLKERMKDALATLKTAGGGKSGYLYDLPWYIIIGPPGSGKTTALVNSGLKFPLSQGATPSAVAGLGGTRYCDWWFTEEAVLIDTARPLHHPGFRCEVRQAELVLLPRTSQEEQAPAADQWRAGRHQHRGLDHAATGRDHRARQCYSRTSARPASAIEGRFSGLCPLHQGRSGCWIH